jgi:23S rRNA pseudouridine1911/1915/1917 synthase
MGVLSLVVVKLFTGVRHLVRAHLSAIGAPIIGDSRYGGRAEPDLSRFFLHAASLTFEHPVTHQTTKVESPLPPELSRVLERLVP